jgi:hypothetical protein
MSTLERTLKLHDELLSIADDVKKSRAFFRKPTGATRRIPGLESAARRPLLDLDRTMCALAIKVRRTSEAVRALCNAAFGEDVGRISQTKRESSSP